jgi:hypothetical protein
MGKVRRGGYLFIWWKGDHDPRHVHVFDSKERLLGRVDVETKAPLDDWKPTRKAVEIINALQREGRL